MRSDLEYPSKLPSTLEKNSEWAQSLGDERLSDYIKDWFFYYYEDPANQTPYESKEGGYKYVYGGPYDARDEINDNFDGLVSEKVMDMAVEKIERDGTLEWAPSDKHADMINFFDDYEKTYGKKNKIDFEQFTKVDFDSAPKQFGNRKEIRIRQKLLGDINSLRDHLKPENHAGPGHNNPPPEFVLDENEIQEIEQALDAIEDGLRSYSPQPGRVAQETYNLQNFLQRKNPWAWAVAGAVGSPFLDGFLKGFFERLGIKAGEFTAEQLLEKLPPLWAKLIEFFASAHEWLQFLAEQIPM